MDERRTSERRVRETRGGRRLEDDPSWGALKASVAAKVNALIRDKYNDSIAEASRQTALAESTLQDMLKLRGDASLSSLHRLARAAGQRVYVFFEAAPVASNEPTGFDSSRQG